MYFMVEKSLFLLTYLCSALGVELNGLSLQHSFWNSMTCECNVSICTSLLHYLPIHVAFEYKVQEYREF